MLSPRELTALLATADDAVRRGLHMALATVVAVEGSSYRRPGARMLVCEDGATAGSVSGGCLEAEVLRRARQSLATGRPAVLRYDTSLDEEGHGASLGCGGRITILVEPLVEGSLHLRALRRVHRTHAPAVLVTRFGPSTREGELGAVACVQEDEEQLSRPASGATETDAALLAEAREALQERRTRVRQDDAVDALVECILPPPAVVIFGAGPGTEPLALCAHVLGHGVTVVEQRPMARPPALPAAIPLLRGEPAEALRAAGANAHTACVVATHNLDYDLRALRAALDTEAGYVGLLGPRHRAAELLRRVQTAAPLAAGDRERIHAPIGLDIGADTPEQIALSILAEIQATFAGRRGRPLREGDAPIHDGERAREERPLRGTVECTFS